MSSLRPHRYTRARREDIARTIKPLDAAKTRADFAALRVASLDNIGLKRTGNRVVDTYTYADRLATTGNKGLDFFTFIHNRAAFAQKEYVRHMVDFCLSITGHTVPEIKCWLRAFTMYFGSVNIFRPLIAMKVYSLFRPTAILDFTAGWGGRMVGACAMDVPHYIGIDSNISLRAPYREMRAFVAPMTKTKVTMMFRDALTVDYTALKYDMVLTSPPYYNLEVYAHATPRASKKEWDTEFYEPLFRATFDGLAPGGHYCLNVSEDIYNRVCVRVLGLADAALAFDKTARPNAYKEYIYVWQKPRET
jgi:hypothetical protein